MADHALAHSDAAQSQELKWWLQTYASWVDMSTLPHEVPPCTGRGFENKRTPTAGGETTQSSVESDDTVALQRSLKDGVVFLMVW